jgi:hypothetical protein
VLLRESTELEVEGAAESESEFTEGNAYQFIIPNCHTIRYNVLMAPTGLPISQLVSHQST